MMSCISISDIYICQIRLHQTVCDYSAVGTFPTGFSFRLCFCQRQLCDSQPTSNHSHKTSIISQGGLCPCESYSQHLISNKKRLHWRNGNLWEKYFQSWTPTENTAELSSEHTSHPQRQANNRLESASLQTASLQVVCLVCVCPAFLRTTQIFLNLRLP